MSFHVDIEFVGRMAPSLELFRPMGGHLYNFRCPICGDSQKNKFKRRAFFYHDKKNDRINFRCHNCGASHILYTFMDLRFPEMIRDYKFQKFSNKKSSGSFLEEAIPMKKEKKLIFDDLVPVDFLSKDHPAREYLEVERKLSEGLLPKFLFCENYVDWLAKTTQEELQYKEHSRILIPFKNQEGNIYRYIARSFDCNIASKYLYTDISEGSSFYNWYSVDRSKKVIVVEGAIDAMLLPNAVAIGNAKYSRGDFDELKDYVIAPDNEPRNIHVVKSIEKAVSAGHPVCFWPVYLGKDINEMYKNEVGISSIVKMIEENTFSGIKAKLKLQQWRKC